MAASIYESHRFMSKVLTALHDRRDDRRLAEIIYNTYDKVRIEDVRDKVKPYFDVLLHLSKAILEACDSGSIVSDNEVEEILQECKKSANAHIIQNIKDNVFSVHARDADIDTIILNCEAHNKATIMSKYAPEIVEVLSAGTSFIELPSNVERFEKIVKTLSMDMSSQTIHKDYRELILLPGATDPGQERPGLRSVHDDLQNESALILKTGIYGFDIILFGGEGIHAGKLTIIGSYAGGGKSILMVNLGVGVMFCKENINLYNLPQFRHKKLVIMIITYENTLLQTYRRFMTLLGLSPAYINSLPFAELKSIMEQIMVTAPIGMIIKARDAKSESASDIASYIKEVEDKHNVKVVLVCHDYINLTVPTTADTNSLGEFMDAGNVAQEIRELVCKRMNIPVISAIQLKREWEDKYMEAVKKGDKMPVRCFSGAALFGGNIVKQKADNLFFVVYGVLNGDPYAEIILDKDRDGNASSKSTTPHKALEAVQGLFEKQGKFVEELTKENISLRPYYGKDGRLAVAIPRNGLALNDDVCYADRFEISPEAAQFMNMFQSLDSLSPEAESALYEKDEFVEEIEAEVPMNESVEDYDGALKFKEEQEKKNNMPA